MVCFTLTTVVYFPTQYTNKYTVFALSFLSWLCHLYCKIEQNTSSLWFATWHCTEWHLLHIAVICNALTFVVLFSSANWFLNLCNKQKSQFKYIFIDPVVSKNLEGIFTYHKQRESDIPELPSVNLTDDPWKTSWNQFFWGPSAS